MMIAFPLGASSIALADAPDSQGRNVTGDKTLSTSDITCGGSTDVTLSLTGTNGVAGNPARIVLVLDRSGSMAGQPLTDLKNASNTFVDIIDEATDGSLDGVISNGSQIGVVSFATGATTDQSLTTDANAVKSAVNGLSASGLTNHEAAFQQASSVLGTPSSGDIVIMMTDGQTTEGGNPDDDAAALRSAGVEIFAIGLGSVNASQLNTWATDPDSEHVFLTPSSSDLQDIFEEIGAAVVVPAATNVTVTDTVDSHFSVSGAVASKGAVAQAGNVLTWTIPELGMETVTLQYTATHDNTQAGGVEQVNDSVTYSDDAGHAVTFPNPSVNVRGCAANLDLDPDSDTNTVGEDHPVTATVTDDFGDPVEGITVNFSVTGGPSVVDGDPSNPVPANGSGATDATGQTTFTYTNTEASPDEITGTVAQGPNVPSALSDTVTKTWRPIRAVIDIKPGSDPNSFGANSRGNIPVALFGSASFDVSLVDDSTVLFGDAPSPAGDASIAHKSGHTQDVDGDGIPDKVYHFPFQDTNLDPTDTEGCLGGEIDGLDFLGCDAVNIVGG